MSTTRINNAIGGIANMNKSRYYHMIEEMGYQKPKWIGLSRKEAEDIYYMYRAIKRNFPTYVHPHYETVSSIALARILFNLNIEKEAQTEIIRNEMTAIINRLRGLRYGELLSLNAKYFALLLKYLNGKGLSYILHMGTIYYTLNDKTIKRLLTENKTEIVGSDAELLESELTDFTIEPVQPKIDNNQFMFEDEGPVVEPIKSTIHGKGFKYICKLPESEDLKRYQIPISQEQAQTYEFSENCLVYALRMSGVDNVVCDAIQLKLKNDSIEQRKIKEVAEQVHRYISIKREGANKNIRYYGNSNDPEIRIGLIMEHYFLIEKTQITKKELDHMCDGSVYHDKTKCMDSYNLIKYISKNIEKYFIDRESKKELHDVFNHIMENTDLSYDENQMNETEFKEKKVNEKTVNIFFDTETSTDGDCHKIYLLRCSDNDKDYVGHDAGYKMLCDLSQKYKDIKLIAHNITYDLNFIWNYLFAPRLIATGKHIKAGTSVFKNGNKQMFVRLQDSYALISMKLREFPNSFGLDGIKKEVMPYHIYTEQNVRVGKLPYKYVIELIEDEYVNKLEKARKHIEKNGYLDYVDKINDERKSFIREFNNNANEWKCIDDNGLFDLIKYSSKYCAMDVKVLESGYNKFRKYILDICQLDINNYITISSIANAYYEKEGAYKGIYELTGKPRCFIQKCVVGGRVMPRKNKQYHVTKRLSDFDAVSLYPSAMIALSKMGGFLKGKPKVLKTTDYNEIKNYDGYFVQIEIMKVGKNYAFPLLSYIDEETGVRNFTNDMVGKKIYVDKISLEDLIEFQQIEFRIIRGYYFNEGRNDLLGKITQHLFDERFKAKSAKNPIQNVYKLILNSAYGKTLLKPIETETKYMTEERAMNYIRKNFENIKQFVKMSDNRYEIKEYILMDNHYNRCQCGVEVLSMSKRLMNRVMCLADDNKYKIYYQDTDSMHIEENCVKPLANKYKEKYGKELIGKQMGQYHCDFESENMRGDKDITSVESYFLGKKSYIDKLEGIKKDTENEITNSYHIRMKGVSTNAILDYSIDVMNTYKQLYEGKMISFDLTVNPCFEYIKEGGVRSKSEFNRRIKF